MTHFPALKPGAATFDQATSPPAALSRAPVDTRIQLCFQGDKAFKAICQPGEIARCS
jgi:hypothetical protein